MSITSHLYFQSCSLKKGVNGLFTTREHDTDMYTSSNYIYIKSKSYTAISHNSRVHTPWKLIRIQVNPDWKQFRYWGVDMADVLHGPVTIA